jgi:hypothetical protein
VRRGECQRDAALVQDILDQLVAYSDMHLEVSWN